MNSLRSQYKSITDDDEAAWLRELKQLEADFGSSRSEQAITAFLRNVPDFPNIAKLRQFIPPPGSHPIADRDCPRCSGTGFERCRHCDCRAPKPNSMSTLDGDADPGCLVCKGRGSLVDNEPRKNNRVRVCSCKQAVAKAA